MLKTRDVTNRNTIRGRIRGRILQSEFPQFHEEDARFGGVLASSSWTEAEASTAEASTAMADDF